jgi:uncharacterized protein
VRAPEPYRAAAPIVFIDLRDLALRGGERYRRDYPLNIAPVVLGGARYEVLVPRGVGLTVDRVAGAFLVTISLAAKVYGLCARCLGEAVLEIEAQQQEFAPTTKDGWEESDLSSFVEDLVVDLAGIAREAVVLALPSQIVCSPSCKGLCPQCGQDLNRGSCDCASVASDERWAKLKDLKLED